MIWFHNPFSMWTRVSKFIKVAFVFLREIWKIENIDSLYNVNMYTVFIYMYIKMYIHVYILKKYNWNILPDPVCVCGGGGVVIRWTSPVPLFRTKSFRELMSKRLNRNDLMIHVNDMTALFVSKTVEILISHVYALTKTKLKKKRGGRGVERTKRFLPPLYYALRDKGYWSVHVNGAIVRSSFKIIEIR